MKSEKFATASSWRDKELRRKAWSVTRWLLCAAFFTLHSSLFTSCSESSDTVEEFADWQNRNETYFEQAYSRHDASSIIKKWTLDASATSYAHTDCILASVLQSGTGTTSPYYTDYVEIYYSGRLIPSTSYPAGYVFDGTPFSELDRDITKPTLLKVSSFTAGFATALQHMHKGDRWRVTVPYQLAYGTTDTSTIPAYSTLIFEIELVDFYSE